MRTKRISIITAATLGIIALAGLPAVGASAATPSAELSAEASAVSALAAATVPALAAAVPSRIVAGDCPGGARSVAMGGEVDTKTRKLVARTIVQRYDRTDYDTCAVVVKSGAFMGVASWTSLTSGGLTHAGNFTQRAGSILSKSGACATVRVKMKDLTGRLMVDRTRTYC